MKLFLTLAVLCTIGVSTSLAQASSDVQPTSSTRGAVVAPGTQAVIVLADSSATILNGQKDLTPAGSAPVETQNNNSGQPATSVRKPD